MSDYEKSLREYVRAKKRQERDELRIAREIGRARKEREKTEVRQQAYQEVDEFQAQLNVVLSLHREVDEQWDWSEIAASLPPHLPATVNRRELRALQNLAIASTAEQKGAEDMIEEAKKGDRLENEALEKSYKADTAEWEKMTALARRIVAGDVAAYRDAVTGFSPLSEMEELGTVIEFTMHSASFVECRLTMRGSTAIPSEIKSLTAAGKLSVKTMPRQQFHEVYQDYICGGVLRVAREMFALLPVDDVLVTVMAPVTDVTGRSSNQPVLSVIVERASLNKMNFELLDPSDAIDALIFRGDFKATRKTGAFQPITPIRYADMALPSHRGNFDELLFRIADLRAKIRGALGKLQEISTK